MCCAGWAEQGRFTQIWRSNLSGCTERRMASQQLFIVIVYLFFVVIILYRLGLFIVVFYCSFVFFGQPLRKRYAAAFNVTLDPVPPFYICRLSLMPPRTHSTRPCCPPSAISVLPTEQ